MTAPRVKGWCPGAYRPMMAADGLVVRIRPRLAQLDAQAALGLCDLALRYGQGALELTNRANLQIRGVTADDHEALLKELNGLGLLDADPVAEGRRNILVTPFWQQGDETDQIAQTLMANLSKLPDLPAKFGFSVDCGPAPVLQADSADIRIERGKSGLILRADGMAAGRLVDVNTVMPAVIELADWLAVRVTTKRRRMADIVVADPLPRAWCDALPLPPAARPIVGAGKTGAMIGAVFGHVDAAALAEVIQKQGLKAVRTTPWRMIYLSGGVMPDAADFITTPDDPLMRVDACIGKPRCAMASVETRQLARRLAPHVTGRLHVSGCEKGCARKLPAQITLVGRNGAFDIIRQGSVGDTPDTYAQSAEDILAGAK
ncbi:MAG: cobalamin biosynthesis protein CobG [Sulfitobacter sp.]